MFRRAAFLQRMGQKSVTGPFFFEARVSAEYHGSSYIDRTPAEFTHEDIRPMMQAAC